DPALGTGTYLLGIVDHALRRVAEEEGKGAVKGGARLLITQLHGFEWMVGPYAGVKLLDNLFLDARAAWGQSDNDIWLNDTVNGFRSGSFDTERWLATTTLTGVHYHGAWRFSPQVGIAYGHESFDTYTTSAGQIVTGDDANIGRLTGGVEVGYRMQARYGVIVEPHVALNGIWNFDSDDLVINGVLNETKETRAEIEGGVLVTTASGWAVRAAGRYDGIGGDDFESYGGSLWVNVPLHKD
ncbi:MAG: autotransporter outer membrane beta-barrel domain-containing protein, partial [Devosia sp.]|nr:autotransporter outer membrane beta-barrel domain-containing protein [Devosia sp.]